MKLEDVKVGMKVVPFKKSAGTLYEEHEFPVYLNRGGSAARQIERTGHAVIKGVSGAIIILGDPNPSINGGDYFLAEDFRPFIVNEE